MAQCCHAETFSPQNGRGLYPDNLEVCFRPRDFSSCHTQSFAKLKMKLQPGAPETCVCEFQMFTEVHPQDLFLHFSPQFQNSEHNGL
jgi:hypothetical protein